MEANQKVQNIIEKLMSVSLSLHDIVQKKSDARRSFSLNL